MVLLSGSASALLAFGASGFRELGSKDRLRRVKMFDAPRDALKAAIARRLTGLPIDDNLDPGDLVAKPVRRGSCSCGSASVAGQL